MRRLGPLLICLTTALAFSAGVPPASLAHGGPEGRLDPSFGNGGIAYSYHFVHVARSRYRWVFREADGDLLVGGSRQTSSEAESEGVLIALLPSGRPDPNFGEGGELIFGAISALALGPGGEIILAADRAGSCSGNNAIFRLEPDGRADPSFGTEGCAAAPFAVSSLAVGGDGRIVLAGQVIYGQPMRDLEIERQIALARLLPDGESDQSFGTDGIARLRDEDNVELTAAQSLAIAPGGGVLVSGTASAVAGFSGKATELIRLGAAAGSLDAGFGTDGRLLLPGRGSAILTGPAEEITVATGGLAGECCSLSRLRLTRLLSDGRPDLTFSQNGSVVLVAARHADPAALSVTPQGGYLVAASLTSTGCSSHCSFVPALLRTDSSGALDHTYGSGGIVLPRAPGAAPIEALAPIAALALGPAGEAFLGGGTYDGGAFLFARGPNGGALAAFGNGGFIAETHTVPANAEPRGLAIAPDGDLYVPAEGETRGVNSRPFVLAFGRNGAVDRNRRSVQGVVMAPGVGRIHPSIVARGNAVYGIDDSYGPAVVRIGLGGADPSFGRGGKVKLPTRFIPRKLLAAPDGGLVVFGRVSDRPGFAAIRIDHRGLIDRAFGTQGIASAELGPPRYSKVGPVLLEPDGALLVAGYSRGAATVMRLTPDGRPDPSFGHLGRVRLLGMNTTAAALTLDEDHIVVAARHETATTKSASILVALEHDGRREPGFGSAGVARPSGITTPLGLFSTGGDLLLVATLGEARAGVMVRAYLPDGRSDRSFGSRGRVLAARGQARLFHPIAAGLQPGGRLVVVGQAGSWLVGNRTELVRFR